MHKFGICVSVVGLVSFSCGGGHKENKALTGNTIPIVRPVLDNSLNAEKQSLLQEDFSSLESIQLHPKVDSEYEKFFGSKNIDGVLRFFNERIKFIISSDVRIEDRIVKKSNLGALDPNQFVQARVIASNQGALLWILHQAEVIKSRKNSEPEPTLEVLINNSPVPVFGTRVGLIQVGSAFSKSMTRADRLATLIHEARHSDCTRGLSETTVEEIVSGKNPTDHYCAHTHAICPNDHELQGLAACDSTPWGAYAAGAVFSGTYSKNCINCSQAEKLEAIAHAIEAKGRLLYNYADMVTGSLGAPEFTSEGLRAGS